MSWSNLIFIASVLWRLDLVDTHDPVLGGVSFLQDVELEVLVADFDIADAVVAGGLALLGVDLAKAVVAQLVHQAVEEDRGSFLVDAELTARRVVVGFLDVTAAVSASSDTHHPQELVDVVRRVTGQTAENDQNVTDVQLAHDFVSLVLGGRHSLADAWNVCVVPSVIVH